VVGINVMDLEGGQLKRPATSISSSHAAVLGISVMDLEGGVLEAACNLHIPMPRSWGRTCVL
jgi:hypothetical protein